MLETLILCPLNLVKMWEDYCHTYRLPSCKVLSYSKVLKQLPDLRRFRLVILDESHNLRNREGKTYRAILEYIQKNDSKCILLSATPYNKDYLDLASQLRLFVPPDKELGIGPERLFQQVDRAQFRGKFQCGSNTLAAFEKSMYPDDWRDLMRVYMVRRTRGFIKANYAKTERVASHLGTGTEVFYQEAAQYFVKASNKLPHFAKNGIECAPPHGRFLACSKIEAPALVALLSSTLFYFWYHAVSDCYHLSDAVVQSFPCPHTVFSDQRLQDLGMRLEKNLHERAKLVKISTSGGDTIEYAAFNYQVCKPLIDDIDVALGSHYDFTDEELDFIVNYDVKYRQGADADEEEE
jgi:hypothetical protein